MAESQEISPFVTVVSLNSGDRFLHDNKICIATDTMGKLHWFDSEPDHRYCVEIYSGKLIRLQRSSIVQRSN